MSEKCKACDGRGVVGDHLQHGFICGVCHGVGIEPELKVGVCRVAQSGWSCPRCSRIYGPSVQICVVCNTKVASKENA